MACRFGVRSDVGIHMRHGPVTSDHMQRRGDDKSTVGLSQVLRLSRNEAVTLLPRVPTTYSCFYAMLTAINIILSSTGRCPRSGISNPHQRGLSLSVISRGQTAGLTSLSVMSQSLQSRGMRTSDGKNAQTVASVTGHLPSGSVPLHIPPRKLSSWTSAPG